MDRRILTVAEKIELFEAAFAIYGENIPHDVFVAIVGNNEQTQLAMRYCFASPTGQILMRLTRDITTNTWSLTSLEDDNDRNEAAANSNYLGYDYEHRRPKLGGKRDTGYVDTE